MGLGSLGPIASAAAESGLSFTPANLAIGALGYLGSQAYDYFRSRSRAPVLRRRVMPSSRLRRLYRRRRRYLRRPRRLVRRAYRRRTARRFTRRRRGCNTKPRGRFCKSSQGGWSMPYFLKRIIPKRLEAALNRKALGVVQILPYTELVTIASYAAKYRMMAFNAGNETPGDTAEALVALAPVKIKIMLTSDLPPQQHLRITLYKCRRVCSDPPGPIASDAWANENDFELPFPTNTTDEVDYALFSDIKQNSRVREFWRPVAVRNVTLVHGQTRTINMVALPRRYLQQNYLVSTHAYQNAFSFALVFEVTGSPVHGDVGGGVIDSVMSPTSVDGVVELVEGFKFRPLSRVSLAVDNDLDDDATNLQVMNLFGTAQDVAV